MSAPAVVLVLGPPLSGAGTVAAALRRRLPDCRVIETAAPPPRPDAVVFVVSAAAPMADCDMDLLCDAVRETDVVVAAVSKIDVHRTWRAVAEGDREALRRRAPRFAATPWVGVAAGPLIGPPVIDPLVDAVRAVLGDGPESGRRDRRNRLRAREASLCRRIEQGEVDARTRRQAESANRTALRIRTRQTRLDLTARARAQALTLRADLRDDAARVRRRDPGPFAAHVRRRVQASADEFDHEVRARIAELAADAGIVVPDVGSAASLADHLPRMHRPVVDDAWTVVLGSSVGLGAGLTLCRIAGGVLPAMTPVVTPAGCAVGLVLAFWGVRTRRLMAVRAALDRWAGEVAAGLRSALEERVLAAESALLAGYAGSAGRTGPPASVSEGPAVRRLLAELAVVRAELGDVPVAPDPG